MHPIRIGSPKVNGGRVNIQVDVPKRIQPFVVSGEFTTEYARSVESCPPGILVIPAIATLAPIAWAAGTTVAVNEVDSVFARNLKQIKQAYRYQYPTIFRASGRTLQYNRLQSYEVPENKVGPAILFSGGVDSLLTYSSLRDHTPTLVTVHGSDIMLNNMVGWDRVRSDIEKFASAEDVPLSPIRSNFREILSYPPLEYCFMNEVNNGWWAAIQYGIALPALCAPLAYLNGHSEVLLSSGYTPDPHYPTAQPATVDQLRWSGGSGRMTDVNLTRQDKLKRLLNRRDTFRADLQIRSCYHDDSGSNCSACEKCYRTILGICIEGCDPNTLGYDVDGSTFRTIRNNLETGDITLDGVGKHFWSELQQRMSDCDSVAIAPLQFRKWFSSVDLDEFAGVGANQQPSNQSVQDRVAKNIFAMPYPVSSYLWNILSTANSNLRDPSGQ